jgi:predicted metalloprotease
VRARLLIVLLLTLALAGCGSEDADRVERDVRERAERVQARAEGVRDRVRKRVNDVLEDIRKAVPEATREQQAPSSRGRTQSGEIDAYLTEVIESVDRYWSLTLAASGRKAPEVSYYWVPRGRRVRSGCRVVADSRAAFYCPADDTIYVAQKLASDVLEGASDEFPGQRAGYGRAMGDFGLAYVVAHEYAHNIQFELGFYRLGTRNGSRPFELQADCMAGLWANSVYKEGRVKPGDVEEAIGTALAVGDFDYSNASHHGTPQERRDAWLLGYREGDPRRCREMIPV